MASDEWRWTDDQGVQRVVRADELRSALASSVLAPSTLVWREGMTSWVPAFTVPELGVAAPGAEPPPDGVTDIGPAPQVATGSELSGITSADREPPQPEPAKPAIQPPALVSPHKVVPNRVEAGSTADTGRPTPTELLEGLTGGAQPSAGKPRPAAGQAGAPLKIGAAPRPIAAPAPRAAAGKTEAGSTASSSATKPGAQRPGGWRKPELGKTKNDEDVTLVAEASEPFKLKQAADAAAPRATPGPAKATQNEAKEPARVASAPLNRRAVTRTALIPGNEAPPDQAAKPTGAARASVPPAPGVRRPSSAPPAAAPRPASNAPPAQRSAQPDANAARAAAGPDAQRTAGAGPMRSTAFMGSARSADGGGEAGVAVPGAPRLPNLVKPSFAIVENTSTDSTGVLPLSGKYAAEPKPDPRPQSPSYVEGAPPFAERTPSFPDASPAQGPTLLGAASPEAQRAPQRSQAPIVETPSAASVSSAPGSYPPVPQPMFGARVEPEMQPIPPGGYGAAPPPAYSEPPPAQRVQPTMRMNSQPPYSAPPPPLALGHPSIPDIRSAPITEQLPGEIRATGALPLVNPKRLSYTPPPLDLVDPSAQPPEAFAEPPPTKVGDPVTVPLSSLFGAGGMLITMAVAAFFIGRCSVAPGPSAQPARAALAALPRLARASLPSPPKPCWMAKQPVRWAPTVLQSVPVDVAPTASGVVAAYARDSREPATVQVDFGAGTFDDKPAEKLQGDIVRVLAPRDGGKLLVTTKDDAGPLAPYVFAPGASPFVIGLAGRGTPSPSVALADKPDGTPVTLWTVPAVEDDKGLEAARVLAYGPKSHAVVFRRSGNILGGYISEGRKPEGGLGVVAGSGGSIGKPSLGTNQREIAVIFADRAKADGAWEIRVGHAPLGQMPRETMVVPLPAGGPGGDAFAPDIAGTADGRWVIVWTEGKTGAYAVRAQTFGADFKPLGDPIAISPPAGNFGQAVVGAAGNYVTTMFLSKGTSGSYELWGAVLQCGS